MRHLPINKKYLKTALFIIFGLITIYGIYRYISPNLLKYLAGNPALQVTLTPPSEDIYTNEEFLISMRVSEGNASAIDLKLEYDSELVEYAKDADPASTGFLPVNENFFDIPLIETTKDAQTGKKILRLIVLSKTDSLVPTPTAPYAMQFGLKFKAANPGTAVFTVLPETIIAGQEVSGPPTKFDLPPDLHLSVLISERNTPTSTPTPTLGTEPTHTPTPTPTTPVSEPTLTPTSTITPSPTITDFTEEDIADVNLNLKIRFQGVTSEPIDLFSEQEVRLILLSSDKRFRHETVTIFTPIGSGIWSGSTEFTDVPIGKSYFIFLKGPKHLQKKICTTDPREPIAGRYSCLSGEIILAEGENNLDFSDVINLAGDIPIQNGIVDAADIIFIRQNFGSQDEENLFKADLNMDGIIDTQDYSLIIVALGFKYDEN